jgi:hypothetical protein
MINFGKFYRNFVTKHDIDPKFKNLKFLVVLSEENLVWGHKLWMYYYSILDEFFCSRDYLAISKYNFTCIQFNIKQLDLNRDDLQIKCKGFKIYDELLKDAFLKSINVLDKVANILVHYEKLPIPERYRKFYGNRSIFEYSSNKDINKNILKKNPDNKYLERLDQISKKFDDSENEEYQWTQYRNKITHDYFFQHDEGIDIRKIKQPLFSEMKTPFPDKSFIDSNNYFSHISHDRFLDCTIGSLKLSKEVIELAIDFINNKDEQIERTESKEKLIKLECGGNPHDI